MQWLNKKYNNIMELLALALAPVLIILFYVYLRDNYEKEPIGILIVCLIIGLFISIPVIIVERLLVGLNQAYSLAPMGLPQAAFGAFMVAALVEEFFKFLPMVLFIWNRPSFDERFDGIVYAVYISLGFAAIENVLYVLSAGKGVAILRMLTAVPAHAIFGITMGYYFGLAKFVPEKRRRYLFLALALPVTLHGTYNFILFSRVPILLLLFIPYMIWLYVRGHRFMQRHREDSEFTPKY